MYCVILINIGVEIVEVVIKYVSLENGKMRCWVFYNVYYGKLLGILLFV